MGLDEDTYDNIMVKYSWFQKRASSIKVTQNNIRNLCTTIKKDAELAAAQPEGCGCTCWWIRLGPTQDGYPRSVVNQVNTKEFMSPYSGSIAT